MTSDNCSKLMCRSAIFFQIEIGMLLAARDLGLEAMVGEVELQAEADPADQVAALLVELLQAPGDRGIGVGLELA